MSPTITHQAFNYDLFRSLAAPDLVAYMEPIVADPALAVSDAALERMASELDTFDEHHLVYGIELGMEHSPARFALQIAHFLSHDCQSVRLAVHRNLSRLPGSMISEALVNACNLAMDRTRFADVADIVNVLRQKRVMAASRT